MVRGGTGEGISCKLLAASFWLLAEQPGCGRLRHRDMSRERGWAPPVGACRFQRLRDVVR